MNKLIYFSFLPVWITFSCTSVKHKSTSTSSLTQVEFSNKVDRKKINYSYLSIKSRAEINVNGQKLSTPMQVRLKKDSVIWISMTPFLGIEALRILIRTDSIFIINKFENKNYFMSMDSVRRMLNLPVTLKELQELFLGELPNSIKSYKSLTQDSVGFNINFEDGNLVGNGIVSSSNLRLIQLNLHKRNKSDSLNIRYHDFKEWEDYDIAYKSLFDIYYKNFSGKLALEHYKIERKDSEITFPFTIPKGPQE